MLIISSWELLHFKTLEKFQMQWTIIFCNWFTNAVGAKATVFSLSSVWLRLEGISGGHLVQPPAPAWPSKGGCPGPCAGRLWVSLRLETPEPPWAAHASVTLTIFPDVQRHPCVMRQLWRFLCCVHSAAFTTFSNGLLHSEAWYSGEEVFSAKYCFCKILWLMEWKHSKAKK